MADHGHFRHPKDFAGVVPEAKIHVDHAWIHHVSADLRPII
jgi:hypothetical protein